jgi:hypothetical protein
MLRRGRKYTVEKVEYIMTLTSLYRGVVSSTLNL